MSKKVIMTKDDFKELMETRGAANSYQALTTTIMKMDDEGELTLDNLLDLIAGVYDVMNHRMNNLIEKHDLEDKSIKDIIVIDLGI